MLRSIPRPIALSFQTRVFDANHDVSLADMDDDVRLLVSASPHTLTKTRRGVCSPLVEEEEEEEGAGERGIGGEGMRVEPRPGVRANVCVCGRVCVSMRVHARAGACGWVGG